MAGSDADGVKAAFALTGKNANRAAARLARNGITSPDQLLRIVGGDGREVTDHDLAIALLKLPGIGRDVAACVMESMGRKWGGWWGRPNGADRVDAHTDTPV